MRNLKILVTTVDLLDPNEIYQGDITNLLIKKLNERHKGRCFQGAYIIDVTRIIKRSSIRMVNDRDDGGAYVDVQFEVDTMILVEGEVLHNCKIIEIHDNGIIAENDYANIKIQRTNNHLYKILKKGQSIPIIVHQVRYLTNKNKISLIGEPFKPLIKDTVFYNITESLTPDQTETVAKLMEEVEAEVALHKSLESSKQYEFFKNLLYPFKTNQKFEKSKIATTLKLEKKPINLKELTSIKGGVVVYPEEQHKHDGVFFVGKSQINDDNSLNATMYTIAMGMLNSYLLYLQALRGFMETYKTPKEGMELKAYWAMCYALKN